ncbi:MAG: DUF6364 family protein [Pseudomonadota bacterium]
MPKNLTLSIDEDLLDKARVLAAMRRTSVNEMVRGFLANEIAREQSQSERQREWRALFLASDTMASVNAEVTEAPIQTDREKLYNEVMRERGIL